jgi:citrate/tricarballylate utilization protein
MTRRLEFGKADIHYLANLCHNCGACLHACQYAPPHEFAVNVPRRWQRCAATRTPSSHGRRRSARCTGATGLRCRSRSPLRFALFLASRWRDGRAVASGGRLLRVVPHGLMVALFLPVFAIRDRGARHRACALLARGAGRPDARPRREAAASALTLRTSTAATAKAATTRTTRSRSRGGRFTTSPSTASCCASRRRASRRVYHYGLDGRRPTAYGTVPKCSASRRRLRWSLGTIGQFVRNVDATDCTRDENAAHDGPRIHRAPVPDGRDGLALMLLRAARLRCALALCVHLGSVLALVPDRCPTASSRTPCTASRRFLKWSIERRQPSRLALPDD